MVTRKLNYRTSPGPFQPQELCSGTSGTRSVTVVRVFLTGQVFCGSKSVFQLVTQYDQHVCYTGTILTGVAGTSSHDFTLSTLAINPVDFSIKEQSNLRLGDDYGTLSTWCSGTSTATRPAHPPAKDRNPIYKRPSSQRTGGAPPRSLTFTTSTGRWRRKQGRTYNFFDSGIRTNSLRKGDCRAAQCASASREGRR